MKRLSIRPKRPEEVKEKPRVHVERWEFTKRREEEYCRVPYQRWTPETDLKYVSEGPPNFSATPFIYRQDL